MFQDQGYEFGHSKNIDFMELNGSVQKKVQDGEIPSSPVDMVVLIFPFG